MSASSTSATPPCSRILSPTSSRRSLRRATSGTRAPCCASATAVAAPIPLEAPVTSAAVPPRATPDDAGISMPTLLLTMDKRGPPSNRVRPVVATRGFRTVAGVSWFRSRGWPAGRGERQPLRPGGPAVTWGTRKPDGRRRCWARRPVQTRAASAVFGDGRSRALWCGGLGGCAQSSSSVLLVFLVSGRRLGSVGVGWTSRVGFVGGARGRGRRAVPSRGARSRRSSRRVRRRRR